MVQSYGKFVLKKLNRNHVFVMHLKQVCVMVIFMSVFGYSCLMGTNTRKITC